MPVDPTNTSGAKAPDRWEDGDLEWVLQYVKTEEYLSLEDYYRQRGLAWEDVKLCGNAL